MKKGVISVIGICGESIFMRLDHFNKPGETVVTDNIHVEAGGKGANQALTIAKLGGKVNYLTALGKDEYAKSCEEVFAAAKLNYQIAFKDGVKTDVGVIFTDKSGENQVTVYTGASAMLCAADVYAFEEKIAESEYLLMQLECSDDVLKAGVELAEKHGVKVILNPAPARQIDPEILKKVYLLTPNEIEAETLLSYYKPENLIITLGKKGARVISGGLDEVIPCVPAKPQNTTGAGDVFNGALAYAICSGKDLTSAVKFANAASSIKVESRYVLDGIPTLSEVEKRLEFFNK